MQKIHILDYKMGNLQSVHNRLKRLGIDATISSNLDDIKRADKLVFPGVGHFGKAMKNLQDLHLIDILNESVLINQKPILGICLGMQLMAKHSEEGDSEGLGWFDATVRRFKINDTLKYKVPHTGWNQISIEKNSQLMSNIDNLSEFYFVHAYHFEIKDQQDILNTTDYESRFVSAIEKKNIFGVQYHPEKSHTAGSVLLKNFIAL